MKQSKNDTIVVSGARMHNLKNIDLTIPRDKLVVFTGLSGSGKSSLAFDTIYAEGQRRYVESLSAYARQFLNQLDKPDVDRIDGLSPAISIDQKAPSHNPRSTVGTVTEIYDYLRVLMSSIGVPHCPSCGGEVRSQSIQEMVDQLMGSTDEEPTIMVLAPIVQDRKGTFTKELDQCRANGFLRVLVDGDILRLSEKIQLSRNHKHTISIVADRFSLSKANEPRLFEAIETATQQTKGMVEIIWTDTDRRQLFSEQFACPDCQVSLPEINTRLFSFNSPVGACGQCRGLGYHLAFDPLLVIQDETLPLRLATQRCLDLDYTAIGRDADQLCRQYGFDLSVRVCDLTPEQYQIIMYGDPDNRSAAWHGIMPALEMRYARFRRDHMRQFLHQFMSERPCDACGGSRLCPEALAVTVSGLSLANITEKSIDDLIAFFNQLTLTDTEAHIADQLLKEIVERLSFLQRVGVGYLNLSRKAGTLSGGEYQRIRLATQIGAGLTGVLYVLDEPSIGLHQRDNQRLIDALCRLRDLGNTLIVVEHDEDMILSADHVVDIGPGAGRYGGNILFSGPVSKLKQSKKSVTADYLFGKNKLKTPKIRRNWTKSLVLTGANNNNIHDVSVEFPLNILTCVTGVSGSGKSTLIHSILKPALIKHTNRQSIKSPLFKSLSGLEHVDKVITIDQTPIGRTPRSNPATYTGVFTPIRDLMAQTKEAKIRGYKAGRFSFNVKGGRCEACQGDGSVKIEMHFLADVYVTCDVCNGKRYNRETLLVTFDNHTIADFLSMTVNQAMESCLKDIPAIHQKLSTLQDVGLGYIQLGQSATTLSGGEAQRIKLAKELSRPQTGNTMYLLDEPTTGLHFKDIQNLLAVLQRLVDMGNTVIVIEHNLDVIKTADYVIDLGPDGGNNGGTIVGFGTPENLAKIKASVTGQYLAPLLQ